MIIVSIAQLTRKPCKIFFITRTTRTNRSILTNRFWISTTIRTAFANKFTHTSLIIVLYHRPLLMFTWVQSYSSKNLWHILTFYDFHFIRTAVNKSESNYRRLTNSKGKKPQIMKTDYIIWKFISFEYCRSIAIESPATISMKTLVYRLHNPNTLYGWIAAKKLNLAID